MQDHRNNKEVASSGNVSTLTMRGFTLEEFKKMTSEMP